MIESNCPDCGRPGKRVRWCRVQGARFVHMVEHVFSCSNPFCPRSRTVWSVIVAEGDA